jgi:pheromone a factor receptor
MFFSKYQQLLGLTLRSFWIRRAQFNQLVASNTALNMSRYLRLMALAMVDICFSVPLSAYMMYISAKGIPLAPWVSWEETHFDFSRVELIPGFYWRNGAGSGIAVELTRWLPVICALLFFGLFGFATEAQKQYKRAFWVVLKPFGVKPSPAGQPKKQSVLPRYAQRMYNPFIADCFH